MYYAHFPDALSSSLHLPIGTASYAEGHDHRPPM